MQSFEETFVKFQRSQDKSHHWSTFFFLSLCSSVSESAYIAILFHSSLSFKIISLLELMHQKECKSTKQACLISQCRMQFMHWYNLIIVINISHYTICFMFLLFILSSYAFIATRIQKFIHWFNKILKWVAILFLSVMIIFKKKDNIQLDETAE